MSQQVRAFLSHSSIDKHLIEGIYKKLTSAHVHYDEATFEKGETSAAEIFRAISDTDVFVLFLSSNSIGSPWVQTEIALAQQKIYAGKIKKILVFILDKFDLSLVPDWLLVYVYNKTSSPGVLVTAIRSALFDVALTLNSAFSIFMGRDKELALLKENLSSLSQDAPQVIFLSGNEGIGRRTLARRALQDVHPQLIKFPIEIVLGGAESDIEFFRSLLSQGEHLTIIDAIKRLEEFTNLASEARTNSLVSLIEKIAEQRQIVFLRGKESVVREDGFLPEWLTLVIAKLNPSPWPKLAIVARRMIPSAKRRNYPNVAFYSINSLDDSASKKLLAIWLKHHSADIDSSLLEEISEYVSGHPRNIQIAATLAAEYGAARLVTQRADFLETIRQQAKSLIEGLKVDVECERTLAIFREYEYLSPEDLFVALGTVHEASLGKTLGYLIDHGVIENEGPYLRMAPYLLDALSRYDWSDETNQFVNECRDRILSRVDSIVAGDFVNISTIDAWVLSALRQDKAESNFLLSRCLLPSHLLKVAREFYDRKEFSKTIGLAQKAYGGRAKLSVEAQVEALRLICLASVRLGTQAELTVALNSLEAMGGNLALRTAAFIKGFKARYEGNIDIAETQFRLAFELGGSRNFHILRELAQILKIKEEFIEAEEFARAAQSIADRNPFILDTLLEIIIERNKDDHRFLLKNTEIHTLFEVLSEIAHREKRSFYESRMAHYFSCLRDTTEAERWAIEAVKTTPFHIPVLLTLAKIQIGVGKTSDAGKTLDKVLKQVHGAGKNADRRNVAELDKLTVLLHMQTGDYSGARTLLTRARALPHKIRENLFKKIDIAEAYSNK